MINKSKLPQSETISRTIMSKLFLFTADKHPTLVGLLLLLDGIVIFSNVLDQSHPEPMTFSDR